METVVMKDLVVSDYVLGTYEGQNTLLHLRFESQNGWWPSKRLCASELSEAATETLDQLTNLLSVTGGTSMELSLQSFNLYGNASWSITRYGIVDLALCQELFRVIKEMLWSTFDHSVIPQRWSTSGQSNMTCEVGTAYKVKTSENGAEVDFHLELPGWATPQEVNSFLAVATAHWWGGRLQHSESHPKGQFLLQGDTRGYQQAVMSYYQSFIATVMQAHFDQTI